MQPVFAELQSISKHYDQPGSGLPNIILNQVSLSIGEADSIAILGPSGSGKSTMLNILGTLDKPTTGKVFLDGTDTNEFDQIRLAAIRNRFIGFVFQQHHLLPQLSLIENVLLPAMAIRDKPARKITMERAHQLIDRVGLKNQIDRLPSQLSVGECQRAAVVRALINQPRLLLADEPTGSLDARNARLLGELLRDLNREINLALVVVTHSMELASCMEKIYRLTSGTLTLAEQK